jgi:predicted metal-dependent hydrolase
MPAISNIILLSPMTDLTDLLDIVRKRTVRRMRLSVDPRTGQIRLTLPERAPLGPALKWAEGHRGWIETQRSKLPEPWPIMPGMLVPYAGKDYWLDWLESHPRTPRIMGDMICVGGPFEGMPARLMRWLRREARTVLDRETREIAARGGYSVGKIGVGDPRSRWGSCSQAGDIRYSWRLILAPADVRIATVAHEVAHRLHMDHSRAFHAEVKRLLGQDPKTARHWLKTHGARLHWFGSGVGCS